MMLDSVGRTIVIASEGIMEECGTDRVKRQPDRRKGDDQWMIESVGTS
jgi:hypothetical protein